MDNNIKMQKKEKITDDDKWEKKIKERENRLKSGAFSITGL